jgi:N-acyl-D-amino-acid deacylase
MFDLVIVNGLVFDGGGEKPALMDLAVQGDEIAEIGHIPREQGKRCIDASELAVSPGFIDIHSHSDLILAAGRRQLEFVKGRITQGITTEVVGNCGIGVAPLDARSKEHLLKLDAWMSPERLEWRWNSLHEYLLHLEHSGVALNVAPLVAHGPVRIMAMGLNGREASNHEMKVMMRLVREAMESGAFGLSFGLVYPPGMYASTQELIELCRVIRPFGGLFACHIRGSSTLLLDAVSEIVQIGETTGVSVQHSHNEAFGEKHFSKIEKTLLLESQARERGIDIAFDVFPYTAAATNMLANYPPWTLEGGIHEFVRRMKDPKTREAVRNEVETTVPAWPPWTKSGWAHNLVAAAGWENISISNLYHERNRRFIGMSMPAVARITGKSAFDALTDLMIEEEGLVSQLIFGCSGGREDEEWLEALIRHPLGAVSTDAVDAQKGLPHPAAYGAYPRVLGRYVREKGVLSLQEAIRKMTSLPASRLALKDRGRLARGMKADIVVFDPRTTRDRATYDQPRQLSAGIEHVLINGQQVVDQGNYNGRLAGTVLRKNC